MLNIINMKIPCIIAAISPTLLSSLVAENQIYETHISLISDNLIESTEKNKISGQIYEAKVDFDLFSYRPYIGTKIVLNEEEITIYKYCHRTFSQIKNGDVIDEVCSLTTRDYVDISNSLERNEYLDSIYTKSPTLDYLYENNVNDAPPTAHEKVHYWSEMLHEIVEYEYNPNRSWENAETILDRGTGDCKAFAIMVHYLLKKDGIEAQPVAVTAGLNRAVNTFHSEENHDGRDHIAIKLMESGAILEVTDSEILGTTPLMYTAATAVGVIDGQEYTVQAKLEITVVVSSDNIEYTYHTLGADDFYYRFASIENFSPIISLHKEIGKYSYAHSYRQNVTKSQNSTIINIAYSHLGEVDEKSFLDNTSIYLPLNRDFRQYAIDGSSGYSLCYIGRDIKLIVKGWPGATGEDFQWERQNSYINTQIYTSGDGNLTFVLEKLQSDRRCHEGEAISTKALLNDTYEELLRLNVYSSL